MTRTDVRLPPLDGGATWVLVDDARAGGQARVFDRPVGIVAANDLADVPAALASLERALADGHVAAGYVGYEAGCAFEPRTTPLFRPDPRGPLLWFGLFERDVVLAPGSIAAALPDRARATVGAPAPDWSEADHAAAIARVLGYIAAGDIYQANLTFGSDVAWTGDPLALYARIRRASSAGYGGIVATGGRVLLSASPELFLELDAGVATARPMKGTARRGTSPAEDARYVAGLRASAKERAENLMITDLIRNDLSRVAAPGGVWAPALMHVETYPTVHQMTSTVRARLAPGCGPVDLLRAAFPCGSITGAPKLRAMEIVRELEPAARGVYTGAIGWLTRDAMRLSVAIRTLDLGDLAGPARLGLGSGIVADSRAAAEWQECLTKAAFLAAG